MIPQRTQVPNNVDSTRLLEPLYVFKKYLRQCCDTSKLYSSIDMSHTDQTVETNVLIRTNRGIYVRTHRNPYKLNVISIDIWCRTSQKSNPHYYVYVHINFNVTFSIISVIMIVYVLSYKPYNISQNFYVLCHIKISSPLISHNT